MSDIVSESVKIVGGWLGNIVPYIGQTKPAEIIERVVVREVEAMQPLYGQVFVRLAGLSGAIAVAMGAYGAHVFTKSEADEKLKLVFETGNRYHLLHSVALLAMPMTRRPYLVGTMMTTGLILFSGSCYFHALTGNTTIRRLTPYGGMFLIAAWASIML